MVPSTPRLVIHGFPSSGGGAGTELRHQIRLWRKMDIEVCLIPSTGGSSALPEHRELTELGVRVFLQDEWKILRPGDRVLSFCNQHTLKRIDQIIHAGALLVFINCMTELFGMERGLAPEGKIAAFGYQNPAVRGKLEAELRGSGCRDSTLFFDFEPWLDPELFPFHFARDANSFVMGHISRPDPAKFSNDTAAIYNAVESPVPKRGIFLGFNFRCAAKTGPLPDWIDRFSSHSQMDPREFYRRCHVILQPTDTTENWPRIGLEAMASGTVLIVDDRGGWQRMIEHGKTGFLCKTPEEFSSYASLLARDPELRGKIARQAYEVFMERTSYAKCAESWSRVMKLFESLPYTYHEVQKKLVQSDSGVGAEGGVSHGTMGEARKRPARRIGI